MQIVCLSSRLAAPGTGMPDIVHQILDFWKGCDSLLAVPLAAAGLVLILAGWRFWQPAVVLSFAAIGAGFAVRLGPETCAPPLRALIGGVALAASTVLLKRYSVPVLGGLVGAAVVGSILRLLRLPDAALWASCGLSFLSLAALSYVYRQHVVILLTAFEGALLVLFALFVVSSHPQSVMYSVGRLIEGSALLLPFAVFAPTVVGLCLQLADASRQKAGAC